MANDDVVAGIFSQGYYPYIIRICPNRQIYELGQQTAENIMTDVGTCVAGSGVNNPGILSYNGTTATCGDVDVIVTLQNLGSDELTAVTLEATNASGSLITFDWTGSLAQFEMEEVNMGTATISAASDITIAVTSADDDTQYSSVTQTVAFSEETTTLITVSIELDSYPAETTWEITDDAGNVMGEGGPYAAGQALQTVEEVVQVGTLGCFSFTIFDDYGDGLNGAAWTGGADGYYTVTSSDGVVVTSGGGAAQFNSEDAPFLATSVVSGIEDVLANESFKIYPNPATDNVSVQLDLLSAQKVSIDVYDMVGKVVFSEDFGTMSAGHSLKALNVSDLNSGIYMMNVNVGENSIVSKFVVKH